MIAIIPFTHGHRVAASEASTDLEIDDLNINVDPHEPNAPSRRGDAELEKALKKIDGINQERPNQ